MTLLKELAVRLQAGDLDGFELVWRSLVRSSDQFWVACESAMRDRDDLNVQRCVEALSDRRNLREMLDSMLERSSQSMQRRINWDFTIDGMLSLLYGTKIALAGTETDSINRREWSNLAFRSVVNDLGEQIDLDCESCGVNSDLDMIDRNLKALSRQSSRIFSTLRDIVRQLCHNPRPVRQRAKLPVLYFDQNDQGYQCVLHCEALADGTGSLFSDPRSMATSMMDFHFARGLALAWKSALKNSGHEEDCSIDIRWSVHGIVSSEGLRSADIPPLLGDSMSATLATVFGQLLTGQEIDDHWALSAALDENGRLCPVGGVRAKARAWFELGRSNAQLLVCESDTKEAFGGAQEAGIAAADQQVHLVKDLKDVQEALARMARLRWGRIQPLPKLDERFTGRAKVIEFVQSFFSSIDGRYLVLSSGLGRGKSALMAKLIHDAFDRGERPIFHMIGQYQDATVVGESLKRQLLRKYQHEPIVLSASDSLEDIMEDINQYLCRRNTKEFLYIDGADQIQIERGALRLLPGILPRELPSQFRCLITSRFDRQWYSEARAIQFLNLEDLQNDREDIRNYLQRYGSDGKSHPLSEELINVLVSDPSSVPVFYTIRKCLEGCVTDDSLRNNPSPWLREPEQLIKEAAADLLEKATRKGISESDVWETLGLLSLIKEPLSADQLDELGLWQPGVTDVVLELSSSFFKPITSKSQPIVFDHPGYVRYVVHDRLMRNQLKQILERIWKACCNWRVLDEARDYALHELPSLLIDLEKWSDLEDLFLDLEYLEARVSYGGSEVYALIADYRQVVQALPIQSEKRWQLKLLLEAILRDASFLAMKPETFFQCMWNSCWWYDCPDAALHHEQPESGWQQPPPWERQGAKLSQLLESWRTIKETQNRDFAWIRSIRPPTYSLGSPLLSIIHAHRFNVLCFAFSTNNRRLVSGSSDCSLRVWDTTNGELLAVLLGHTHGICDVAYSPDGRYIVSGSEDTTIRIWDAETFQELRKLEGHSGSVRRVGFSEDGLTVFSASTDQSVRSWNSQNGQQLNLWSDLKASFQSTAFSHDGTKFAYATEDHRIVLRDLARGGELAHWSGHDDTITSVAFSPKGDCVASGTLHGNICVWEVRTGSKIFEKWECSERVQCLAFSPDGKKLIGATDRIAYVWDIKSGDEMQVLRGHSGWVSVAAFVPNGKRIITGSWDETIRVWDAEVYDLQPIPKAFGQWITCVSFSRDGKRIVGGDRDGAIRVWDAEQGQLLTTIRGHEARINDVAFSVDGHRIVSSSNDRTIRMWDAETQETLGYLCEQECISKVTFLPEGFVFGKVDEGRYRIWDFDNSELLNEMVVDEQNYFVSFSHDGLWMINASNGPDLSFSVISTSGGQEPKLIRGYTVENLCCSHNDSIIVAYHESSRRWVALSLHQLLAGDRIHPVAEFNIPEIKPRAYLDGKWIAMQGSHLQIYEMMPSKLTIRR